MVGGTNGEFTICPGTLFGDGSSVVKRIEILVRKAIGKAVGER